MTKFYILTTFYMIIIVVSCGTLTYNINLALENLLNKKDKPINTFLMMISLIILIIFIVNFIIMFNKMIW